MKKLTNTKLEKISGGGLSVAAMIGIGALIIFLSGLLEGITNPSKCNI